MAAVSILSKAELSDRHPDTEWRRRLARLAQLSDLLGSCIIASDYRVTDAMNEAIQLTEYGRKVHAEVVKASVNAKDARLMCLLKLYHIDLLVDVDATKLEDLEKAISVQVKSQVLKYPFVFGRELYDAAADQLDVEESRLTTRETQELLVKIPQGVFQLGPYVTGPFGLLSVDHERFLPPGRTVPLYHCADPSCSIIHPCTLSTSWDAPINDGRTTLERVLDKESLEPSEWSDFINDLLTDERAMFDDFDLEVIWYLIGDALSDAEIRTLLGHVLDNTGGETRALLSSSGGPKETRADKITTPLARAQIMQILLSRPTAEIVTMLDMLVHSGGIQIPKTEIRRAVVNRGARYGRFALRAELGSWGSRVLSDDLNLAPLRLRRLIAELFPIDSTQQEIELDWQLRAVEGHSVQGRLADFVRTGDPDDVVKTLILASRANVLAACQKLGIDDSSERSDSDLTSTILWKLGFAVDFRGDVWANFTRFHHRMVQTAQSFGNPSVLDQESLRGLGANYFVALEELLDDTLFYSTWALCFDHYGAEKPFTFIPEKHLPWARELLNARVRNVQGDDDETGFFTEKNTLGPLIAGFAHLATLLEEYVVTSQDYVRPSSGTPRYVGNTQLREFPFLHTVAFLDVLDSGKRQIIDGLRRVTEELTTGEVAAVRNDQLHFRRRSSADSEKLRGGLAAVNRVVDELEVLGLLRREYKMTSVVSDVWDRTTYVLTDGDGRERAFLTPSAYGWLRLPGMKSSQYLVLAATFAEPDEMLRFRLEPVSSYAEMWRGYPRPRTRRSPISPLPPREEARVSELESAGPH